ncbi:MAG: hypothetical protein FWE06_06410 [Oscillospiraceae bacterium]|nr:hypothetical protein [Oscillospiraceae bacterium]
MQKNTHERLVNIPDCFEIHSDFLKHIRKEEFEIAFRQIWDIFNHIYEDISAKQQEFGIPANVKMYGATIYRPISLLYLLFVSGVVESQTLTANVEKFNELNLTEHNASSKLKNIPALIERLHDYGFVFEGLNGYKIPKSAHSIEICYPDNPNIITVLKYMADKAYRHGKRNNFNSCYFRLLDESVDVVTYDKGMTVFADRLNTQSERDFAYTFDKALRESGFFAHERHGYSYYDKESVMRSKGAYHFKLERLDKETARQAYASSLALLFSEMDNNDKVLILCLRIRNAEKCLTYLEQCPDTVKAIFRGSDNGCGYRAKCDIGNDYLFEGNTHWRCSCCRAMFHCLPQISDIPHYIKLVELGFK